MSRLLVAIVIFTAVLAQSAFADSLVSGLGTNSTSPLPANSCFYVDQGGTTDTKLCSGWAIAIGAVPLNGALGTPTSGTLTSATGLPVSTGISGFGTGVATFLGTASSANLRAALTDETGTGLAYFQGGDIGTPSAGVATNLTGLPVSTGISGFGTGVAAFLGTPSVTNFASMLTLPPLTVAIGGTGATTLTGHGAVVMNTAGTAQATVAPGTSGNLLTSNGTDWISATPGVGGTVTSVTLAAGNTKTVGTCNTGSDAITTSGTITPQNCIITKTLDYTLDPANGDAGRMIVFTAASKTGTLPNPSAGTKGNCFLIGSDGTNGFTLTTTGGTATLYGFSGGGGTSVVFPVNRDVMPCDDGTNYKVTVGASQIVPVSLTWAPGINPNNLPITSINEGKIIVGIRCTPEVLAGGAATIQPVKAASATAISAGTNLTSTTCDANSGAATDQNLTMSSTTLAAGDRIGIKTTGTTVWTSSGVAAGVITVFLR